MIRALFVCGPARALSPTAAQVFAERAGVQTEFGGIGRDADHALSVDHIEWADIIFVMEQRHQTRLSDRFGRAMAGRRVINLRIPEQYGFMDPALVRLIAERAGPYLRG